MNAAERFQREAHAEAERKAVEQDDQLHRASPTLVYKDHTTETPTPPQIAKSEISKLVERQIKSHLAPLNAVIAEFVCTREYAQRDKLRAEAAVISDSLNALRSEVITLREQADRDRERAECERSLSRQAIETSRGECESLHRTVSALRDQLALERGIAALNDEVATARSEIPNFNALEARFNSEQSNLEAKQARLARELKATKDKLATLRADQSQTDYKISEHIRETPPPAVELRFESADGNFTMRDVHPSALEAWRRFVRDMVEANDGTLFPNDPNGHIVPLAARKPEGSA